MKKSEKVSTETELVDLKNKMDVILQELASSEDFILSYIKVLALVHGGSFNLEELKQKYNWKMPKVHALSAAINHFAARGLIKRGASVNDVIVK